MLLHELYYNNIKLPNEMFHVSRKKNRNSILSKGLLAITKEYIYLKRTPGIYLLETLQQAEDFALYFGNTEKTGPIDIWRVKIPENSKIFKDTTDMDDMYDAWILYQTIPPENLSIEKTITPFYFKDLDWYHAPKNMKMRDKTIYHK